MDGFEQEINNLTSENEKLLKDKELLNQKLSEANEKIKTLEKKKDRENEGLYEKIKILQNTLDLYSNKSNESEETVKKLENQISELKMENSDVKAKHDNLVYEMEINYKNLKNNFLLEKNIKDLTEENEKLLTQIKNLQAAEDYKLKYLQLETHSKELDENLVITRRQTDKLSEEIKKLSSENFEKFQKINSLEAELKIKAHKVDEIEKEKFRLKKAFEEAEVKVKNFEYMIKTININNENHIKELKKEIDKLVKINEQQKREIKDSKTQLDVNFFC